MGQAEFDACIAAGGSAATCAVHLEGEESLTELSGLAGTAFIESTSGFLGVLQPVKSGVSGAIVGYKLVSQDGQSFKLSSGMQLVSGTGRSFDIGSSGTSGLPALVGFGSTGQLTEAQFNRLTGGGGAGRAPPSFPSTQAAQTQAETFAREQAQRDAAIAAQAATLAAERAAEQDRLDREFREEQNRLAEEAALKRGRLSTLTDLIQSFVASQSQARDTLANLQPDPFRFAAVAGGIAPFGVTPQQGFTEQLQNFASAPAPTADPNASLPSIESAIQGLTGAQVPLAPQTFGLAGGGTVAPSAQPQSFLVGEKGPEVMTVTAQGVQVTPLVGGMQEGGAIGFPFEPIEFDRSTLLPALGTSGIFGSLGFESLPASRLGSSGIASGGNVQVEGGEIGFGTTLSRLGIAPRLVRNATTGAIFFRNPSGELQHLSPTAFRQAGIDISDVVNLNATEISRLGSFGADLHQAPPPFSATQQPSPFTKFSQPIVEPTTGTLLPAPFMVAEDLNQLRVNQPFKFNLLLSAYRSAGVPVEAVLGSLQSSLSFGQERGSVGLR